MFLVSLVHERHLNIVPLYLLVRSYLLWWCILLGYFSHCPFNILLIWRFGLLCLYGDCWTQSHFFSLCVFSSSHVFVRHEMLFFSVITDASDKAAFVEISYDYFFGVVCVISTNCDFVLLMVFLDSDVTFCIFFMEKYIVLLCFFVVLGVLSESSIIWKNSLETMLLFMDVVVCCILPFFRVAISVWLCVVW